MDWLSAKSIILRIASRCERCLDRTHTVVAGQCLYELILVFWYRCHFLSWNACFWIQCYMYIVLWTFKTPFCKIEYILQLYFDGVGFELLLVQWKHVWWNTGFLPVFFPEKKRRKTCCFCWWSRPVVRINSKNDLNKLNTRYSWSSKNKQASIWKVNINRLLQSTRIVVEHLYRTVYNCPGRRQKMKCILLSSSCNSWRSKVDLNVF